MKRLLSFLAALLLPVCALAQTGGDIASGPPSLASLGGLTQTQGDARYCRLTGGAGCTMVGDILFTDASFDIGKTGATRPRNIFASGTGTFGSTLTGAGVVVNGGGVLTLTNASVFSDITNGVFLYRNNGNTAGFSIDTTIDAIVKFRNRANGADAAITAAAITASGLVGLQVAGTPTCGSGCASVTGTPQAFTVTTGTAQTSVTVNFGITYPATPRCTLGSGATASVVDVASKSTTAITLGASVALTATPIDVLCF